MAKYSQNGQCEVSKIELVFDNENIDLSHIFMDITLFESIFNPTMSGSVTIVDSNGMINTNALGNGERIRIHYKTSGTEQKVKYEGEVYKISPPTRVSEKTTGIVIYFASPEMIESSRNRVNSGFNEEISSIVSKVFEPLKSSKNLESVRTSGISHVVGASQNSFEFIYSLARRAKSSTGKLGYVFFEDTKKFNFKPIEELYTQEPVSEYFYKSSGIYDDVKKKEEETFNTVQDYEIFEVPDLLNQIEDGVYGSNCVNLNMLEKSITRITYDDENDFSVDLTLGKTPVARSSLISEKKEDRKEIFVGDIFKDENISRFKNYMKLMGVHKLGARITVFGDSSLPCGSVIICDLPLWAKDVKKTSNKLPDPYSGKVLVAEIKHVIKKTGYTQTMRLIKNGFEVGYQ